jgi:hypothetical protein
MADIKMVLVQALVGSALILALTALTALPPVKALLPQWDSPLMLVIGLTAVLTLGAGLGVVFAQHWLPYSIAAGVWTIAAMLLGALATAVVHAEATEKAGPAGMAFILPVILFFFALPTGLAIRFILAAFRT